jgi:hypothetical protein
MSTKIPSQAEYEAREVANVLRDFERAERAPLAERKEAQKDYFRVMAEDPAQVAERIGWLFDGHYGYGPMVKAKQILRSPRMNRPAALSQYVALYDHQCPPRMAADAWKKLTRGQKETLDAAIAVVISAAEKEEE